MASRHGSCKRCGQCCERFYLAYAPRTLWADFNRWKAGTKKAKYGSGYRHDIHIIAPMVRLVEKPKKRGGRYVYRCVHVSHDKKGKATCGIHQCRPWMCRMFPDYDKLPSDITKEFKDLHSKWFPGCRYYDKGRNTKKTTVR